MVAIMMMSVMAFAQDNNTCCKKDGEKKECCQKKAECKKAECQKKAECKKVECKKAECKKADKKCTECKKCSDWKKKGTNECCKKQEGCQKKSDK